MVKSKWTPRLVIALAALVLILSLGVVDALLYVLLGPKDPLHLVIAIPSVTAVYMAMCLRGPSLLGDYLETRNVNLNTRAPLIVPPLGITAAALLVAGSYLMVKSAVPAPLQVLGALLFGLGIAVLAFVMRCVRPTKRS